MNNFTRDNLKQGMIAELRNGNKLTILSANLHYDFTNYEDYKNDETYNDDLTSQHDKTEDIIKVTFGNETVYERQEPKTTWFEPKENEEYYYSVEGYVGSTKRNHNIDEDILKSQQVFQTREDAEKHLEWQQAHIRILKEIARLNDGWRPNWENRIKNKFFLEYLYEEGKERFVIDCYSSYQLLPNNMYLKSEELALKLIETHKDDLLIYFEVEK